MRLNLGLDPIFKFECRMSSRRWQHFAGRVLFIGMLVTVLGFVVWTVAKQTQYATRRNEMAQAGEAFYIAIMLTQLSLLLLAAPAVAADAICLDKARGALLPLLTTELTSYEIVMGKFIARCLPIFSYVFCGLPVLAICLLLGGIHPEAVFEAYLVCSGVALVGGAAALFLSVWCTKTYEVLLVCYLAWILFLLTWPIIMLMPSGFTTLLQQWSLVDLLQYSNPYYLCLAPYEDPGAVNIVHFLCFFLCCGLVSLLFAGGAMLGLRRVVLRQGSIPTKRVRRRWLPFRLRLPRLPGPSLDGNPVLWREWSRQRPSWWVRGVWRVYALAALAGSAFSVVQLLRDSNMFLRESGMIVNAIQVPVGLLLVSVASVTSLQDERVRGSLDVLLTSPMSTRQIFWGKWWGSFRTVLWLTILPTLVAAGGWVRHISFDDPFADLAYHRSIFFFLMPLVIICYGAVVVSTGTALGVWIRQPGRAMAASVTIFICLNVGLLFTIPLYSGDEPYAAFGSCLLAATLLTANCLEGGSGPEFFVSSLMLWSAIQCLIAVLLSVRACRSFDRRMGRMPLDLKASMPSKREQKRFRRRELARLAAAEAS